MGKKTLESEDTWHGVLDGKKRKQIQDRLAQRARRQRIAQSKSSPRSSSSENESISSHSPPTFPFEAPRTGHFAPYNKSIPALPPTNLTLALLPNPDLNIYSALFQNGIILGIACASSDVCRSKPALPHVPISLQPTKLQLEEVHFDWIDRFPMPDFRDRMISSTGLFSTEELLLELFTKETFLLKPGAASWDPAAWTPAESFRKRWNVLFE